MKYIIKYRCYILCLMNLFIWHKSLIFAMDYTITHTLQQNGYGIEEDGLLNLPINSMALHKAVNNMQRAVRFLHSTMDKKKAAIVSDFASKFNVLEEEKKEAIRNITQVYNDKKIALEEEKNSVIDSMNNKVLCHKDTLIEQATHDACKEFNSAALTSIKDYIKEIAQKESLDSEWKKDLYNRFFTCLVQMKKIIIAGEGLHEQEAFMQNIREQNKFFLTNVSILDSQEGSVYDELVSKTSLLEYMMKMHKKIYHFICANLSMERQSVNLDSRLAISLLYEINATLAKKGSMAVPMLSSEEQQIIIDAMVAEHMLVMKPHLVGHQVVSVITTGKPIEEINKNILELELLKKKYAHIKPIN